uniref:acetyl-CoA carboxylase subunit beta n=1 Tax=Hypecoum zhukanum TaxID=2992612 RepID=UPI0023AAC443|nr:acetyl-CoA carboxylase subunit beta [Hypecoum zhukanum]WCF60119.1 acetyl-CoA carboxylase subunit beta [Hypecoum zhukanum]
MIIHRCYLKLMGRSQEGNMDKGRFDFERELCERAMKEMLRSLEETIKIETIKIMQILNTLEWQLYLDPYGYCNSENDSDVSNGSDDESDNDSSVCSESVDSDNDSDSSSPICSESVDSDNDSDSSSPIYSESGDSNQSESSSITTITSQENDINPTRNYSHLWVQCESCYGLNYKRLFMEKLYICEFCDFYVKMRSSDRIELSIDPGTWEPMDEDMVSLDPIEFHSDDDEPYNARIDSYQRETGLTEAVQTGIGEINGLPIAMAVMDFQFIGGSMGSVVGEKITRLIEYATNESLPLIIVCASGGARMQEGSVSLMQMAKISSASYNYQIIKKLFYVSILTSPTTGGVTASFGMLGDIIISEPNAYIAFAGKRVIEETLNLTLPDGSQEAEYLFHNGLLDPIVPRNLLKGVLSELFHIHGLFPLTQN